MYETLNLIPLFQGLNGQDLNLIFEKTHFIIECLEEGDELVHQGELCHRMTFLLSGTLQEETLSPDRVFTVKGRIEGPVLLEPEILYGIQREWSSTYSAIDVCRLMLIPKQDINRLISKFEIFRLNYLNALCTLAARRRQKAWTPPAPTLRERMVLFVKQRTAQTSGPLELVIRMRDLGSHLGATRSLISMVLHDMEKDGVISSSRGSIYIPDLAALH